MSQDPNRLQSLSERADREWSLPDKDREEWLHIYEQMFKIRTFEEHVNELYQSAKMPGLAHLYIGEEAVAVGVCAALRREDYITSTHRGHGHCLAKGASLERMFCELLGKQPGYCRGKGGSMHIADPDSGNLGANAIVAGSAGIATGAAFSSKRLGSGRVVACFFGDGALGQGVLYEVMNMAQLWTLPILYVCENNLYNEYTHYTETTAGSLRARAEAFGILTVEVNGQDVREVHQTTLELAERARQGEGPAFLLCHTYRFLGHHVGDINREYYRSKEEELEWKTQRDPLKLLSGWLVDNQMADIGVLEQLEKGVQAEVAAALEYALQAPFPAPEEVSMHVYA